MSSLFADPDDTHPKGTARVLPRSPGFDGHRPDIALLPNTPNRKSGGYSIRHDAIFFLSLGAVGRVVTKSIKSLNVYSQ